MSKNMRSFFKNSFSNKKGNMFCCICVILQIPTNEMKSNQAFWEVLYYPRFNLEMT